ncbi:hypothetical protein FNO01nite_33480 [Flavobacterium noncentrifugens]|nr:hypothetical protein FNO01nite_33480 [Flavobacterium noncentrifugens]
MNGNAAEIVIADGAVVYLCKSAGAKCYHLKRDCRGLKRCRHMVEESDKETAENIGLTMCSYEN